MKLSRKQTIMRRVYYSYGLSMVSEVLFWQGMFLSVTALLLGKWLHVASIAHNFLSVPVGNAPQYIWNSFWNAATNGEFLTVLTLLLACSMTVSALSRLAQTIPGRFSIVNTV